MPFRVYKDEDVKSALNELFGRKCAYCESSYEATQPMEVEHFRPKGEVCTANGDIRPIGYWWLASAWQNLLPSCNDCNRGRWHKVGNRRFFYGKHSKFPLATDDHAVDPVAVAAESPLLIDPSWEDPSVHLGFRIDENNDPVVYAKLAIQNVEDPKGC